MRSVLIAGSGAEDALLPAWEHQGYAVTRLDIDPSARPDIVADMVNMGEVGVHDVVYCSHALEHLYPHQVRPALLEFLRVLRPGGTATVIVPDLEGVPPTDDPLPGLGLPGLHLFYGDPTEIEAHPHMAHHCGFVERTLRAVMEAAGFSSVKTARMAHHNLMAVGIKP